MFEQETSIIGVWQQLCNRVAEIRRVEALESLLLGTCQLRAGASNLLVVIEVVDMHLDLFEVGGYLHAKVLDLILRWLGCSDWRDQTIRADCYRSPWGSNLEGFGE